MSTSRAAYPSTGRVPESPWRSLFIRLSDGAGAEYVAMTGELSILDWCGRSAVFGQDRGRREAGANSGSHPEGQLAGNIPTAEEIQVVPVERLEDVLRFTLVGGLDESIAPGRSSVRGDRHCLPVCSVTVALQDNLHGSPPLLDFADRDSYNEVQLCRERDRGWRHGGRGAFGARDQGRLSAVAASGAACVPWHGSALRRRAAEVGART